MSKLIDMSLRTRVFRGDLKYGRTSNGIAVKGKDFTGEDNAPVVPLVLVEPRDPQVWRKDNRIKEAKKQVGSQHSINRIIEAYQTANLRSNITLKVGKQVM